MLHLLDVQDSDRVLEIGTGSGYNTALLCHRVGDTAVTSVDIDPILVAEAQARLAQIDYRPQIAAGDGAKGLEQDSPYSRILSTCASPGVPAAWITQLADGGKIVAPFTVGGALAVLTKAENRATAEFPASNTANSSVITQDQRRLFDTVEAAWQTWQRCGRPNRKRIGITAHADGTQNAWLDSPMSGMTWPLPT